MVERATWTSHSRVGMPALDHVAMLCMMLDSEDRVRWVNDVAVALIRGADRHDGTLAQLVHPAEQPAIAVAVQEAHAGGRGEVTVRVSDAGSPPALRHVQLVITRTGRAARESIEPAPIRTGLVVQGWDVTALVNRIHELEIHAFQDPLTGLANRSTFAARLEHELARSHRSGQNVAVLFADIDHFKQVNDTYGHGTGDKVLIALGERLSEILRPGDTLARIGGDEFAVICPDLVNRGQAIAVMDRLRVAAAVPAVVGRLRIAVSLSMGLAFAGDSDRDDAGVRLLSRADEAMYAVKRAPRRSEDLARIRERDNLRGEGPHWKAMESDRE